VSHRLDDFPAPCGGAHGHGQSAGQLNPERDRHVRDPVPDEKRQSNDAHSFLSVIGAVAGSHKS
jgi:hypothetical protein